MKIHQLCRNNQNQNKFGISLILGIAYAASIGGLGTLVGTPPNIIFAGVVKNMYSSLPVIDFALAGKLRFLLLKT